MLGTFTPIVAANCSSTSCRIQLSEGSKAASRVSEVASTKVEMVDLAA